MQYLGGKAINGKSIAEIINNHIKPGDIYWEPFVGAAGCMQHIKSDFRIGSDIDMNIIAMHVAMQCGWTPPNTVSEQEYQRVRNLDPKSPLDCALKAFVGYGCSFGGKWFGGYARNNSGGDYVLRAHKASIITAGLTKDVMFYCDTYTTEPIKWDVCYLDPPYSNVTRPGKGGVFDNDDFWGWVDSKRKDNKIIFVSSFEAPGFCREVWSRRYAGLASKSKGSNVERLFIVE